LGGGANAPAPVFYAYDENGPSRAWPAPVLDLDQIPVDPSPINLSNREGILFQNAFSSLFGSDL